MTGRIVHGAPRGMLDLAVVAAREIRDVLAVRCGHDAEREPNVAVGVVVVWRAHHA